MEQSVGGIHFVALYAVVLRLLMDWSLPKMYMVTYMRFKQKLGHWFEGELAGYIGTITSKPPTPLLLMKQERKGDTKSK